MPIIKSAKKKLRQDVKRTKINLRYKTALEKALKSVKQNKKGEELKKIVKEACSKIDKAVKAKLMHKNKASRLKAKIAKLTSKSK